MTTQEIADAPWGRGYRFSVPVAESLQIPEVDLPIDPWLLGMWLGDGEKSMVSICSGDEDLPYLTGRIEALGLDYRIHRYPNRAAKVYVKGMRGVFADQNLLKHPRTGLHGMKHIPEQYLTASEDQRRQLLAGILDSDGTVGDHQVSVGMNNECLMLQVLQLVRSLGYRATCREHRARLNGQDAGPMYWVKFATGRGDSPFGMPRKTARFEEKKPAVNVLRNSIVDVQPVTSRPVRCITVAHESEMYVVGEGFVPTHNTQNSRSFAFQDEVKLEWDAQLSMALYAEDEEWGVLLVLEAGHPYHMREYRVERNDRLLGEIFAKFDEVTEAIQKDTPPPHCCAKGSLDMHRCPARFQCWLKDRP
jgi:hypothetical protein